MKRLFTLTLAGLLATAIGQIHAAPTNPAPDENGCVRTSTWPHERGVPGCGAPREEPVDYEEPMLEPAPPPVAAEPAMVARETVVLFEFDSSALSTDAQQQLRELARAINANGRITSVSVRGHTCSIGTMDYNQDLGLRRARSVAAALIDFGVPERLISTVSRGQNSPAASNDTDQGRRLNRRVVVYISER